MNDRITFFGVAYELNDTKAADDASYTTNSLSWTTPSLLSTEGGNVQFMNYGDLNSCVLDGSLVELDDAKSNIPFVSDAKSSSSGEIDSSILIEFDEYHSSFGITIDFNHSYPLEATIIAYRGDNILSSSNSSITSSRLIARIDAENYDRIIIKFTKAFPNQHIVISHIQYGVTIYWDERNVENASLVKEVDRTNDKLPIDTLSFSVVDVRNVLNLGNTYGIHRYFQKNQLLNPYEYFNGTYIQLGNYFLDKFSNENDLGKMSAKSYIGILDEMQFTHGDLYEGVPAKNVIDAIMLDAGIENYEVDDYTSGINLYGMLKPMTCRKALREVLFVTGSDIDTSGDSIRIMQRNESISGKLTRNKKISTKISKNDYVYGVELSYKTYELESTLTTLINQDEYEVGTYHLSYDTPYENSYTITGASIVNSGKFFIDFQVTTAGKVTLSAKKYNEVKHSLTTTRNFLEAGEFPTIKKYSSELCNAKSAVEVSKRLLDYLSNRVKIDVQTLAEETSMYEGKFIENPTQYTKKYFGNEEVTVSTSDFVGMYTKRNLDLSKGFIDNATIIGRVCDANYYDYCGEFSAGEQIGVL